jgi:hypothetical protein
MSKITEGFSALVGKTKAYAGRWDRSLDKILEKDIVGVTASILVVTIFVPIVLTVALVAAVIALFTEIK